MYTSNTNVLSLCFDVCQSGLFFLRLSSPLVLPYEKIFQAIGWMKETMVCMLVGFVTNIILDPLLILALVLFQNGASGVLPSQPDPVRF